jgi:membrane protease YdiL (CAAX protease family)
VEPIEIDPASPFVPQEPVNGRAIAPVWHTVVLVAGIVAYSIHGASRFSAAHGPVDRLATYGMTMAMEAGIFAWVVLGLRLKKTPLRLLFGHSTLSLRSIAADIGFAFVFWIAALMVLGTLSVAWLGVEAAITHRSPIADAVRQTVQTGQTSTPDSSRGQALRAVAEVAPANGREIAAWALLCLIAGFVEEVVFRGYLQRQFIGWARGSVAAGVIASALVFGGAHGYEGARAMFLITVFGVLFSLLALYRRSLRAGIFAHVWHDLITGLVVFVLRSFHIF